MQISYGSHIENSSFVKSHFSSFPFFRFFFFVFVSHELFGVRVYVKVSQVVIYSIECLCEK